MLFFLISLGKANALLLYIDAKLIWIYTVFLIIFVILLLRQDGPLLLRLV